MADSVEEAEKDLKELENEITCAICQEHYTQPKVLPCLHYYCKHCILKLALRTGIDQPFSCPECRKEAILPEGNEDNLQTAFFINRFKALYDKQRRALNKKEVKCERCTTSQVKAEAFCRQCDKFVCEECIKSHPTKVVFNGHQIVSLDEVKELRANEVLVKNSAKKCQLHNELLKIFCFECNQLICRDCTVREHKDHEFELNHIVAMNKRKELIEGLMPLRGVTASLSRAVEAVQIAEHELGAQAESVAIKIETSFVEFHTIVEKHKQKMLKEARRRASEKMENLEGQRKSISISAVQVQRIVDHTEQCVEHYSDEEIMCVHAEIRSHIKREIEECNKPGRSLTPVEEVDIGVEVKCVEALEELLQTQTKIIQLPLSVVIDRITNEAEVNKLSEVSLYTTKLFNNKPARRAVQIQCQQKSLCNGSLIKCNLEEIAAGQYRIQYTPTLRGRHELTISVNGQQSVTGSPFDMFVPIPPAQLGELIKAYSGITDPNGITVNSVGEIIVAEYAGDVVVLDKEGKRSRIINRSEHKFQSLQGIAVDHEDNIYFTDLDNDRIFTSNKNCSKVQVHRVKQVKGPGHLYVAVVGDEVMVTECGNEGRIMVYDRELKYVRQIVGADKNTLWALSSDSHQNVYVTVLANSSIQVFSNDGAFLRSFGCDKNGVKRLKSPCGVCVAGQHVYVADYGMHKIVVFSTEGDYVTSFGVGHYSRVCVDRDGFVYASHYNCDEIHTY